jgi:hypothetical protein
LLFIPATPRTRWVGYTRLEIECVVTDAGTGEPIRGATILVHSEGGLCGERDKQRFALVTGPDGVVKRLCEDCMCFGTTGWGVDTYFVHLPCWLYQVTADGYAPTEWAWLDVPENARRVRRGEPAAKLVLRIELAKEPAEPGGP